MSDNIEEQFLAIHKQYADAIFRYCFLRVYDREQAKDISQETFVRTWRYLASGQTIDNVKAFLYKVATNLIIDNSRKPKDLSLEDLAELGFEPAVDNREALTNFLAGLGALKKLDDMDDKYRQVITMRFVQDLSPKEIAQATGESENLISVRIHRGLKKLKELLENPE